ncbi:YopX family protein [Enterococcus faecium]|nr:YopX family protein [Enterococcus faecium]
MIPKFRAYSKEENEMYYPHNDKNVDWTIDDETGFIAPLVNLGGGMWGMIDKYELMQSTGLIDRNGVEIFDGDVVQAEQYLTTTIPVRINGIVKYSNRYTMFYLDNGSERHDLYMQSLGGSIYNFEIIGNIYENPELSGDEQR